MKNMKTLEEFLKKHYACKDGFEFAKDLTLEQFLNTCERGDWILWLFKRINPKSDRLLVLAAAHCANTVRHLMKDERSIEAIDIAIKYGNNEATKEELAYAANAAATAAYVANAADMDDMAAYAAAYVANAADMADVTATYAAYATATAAYATARAAYVANAAQKANQKLTADICRQYLPIKIWNKI